MLETADLLNATVVKVGSFFIDIKANSVVTVHHCSDTFCCACFFQRYSKF